MRVDSSCGACVQRISGSHKPWSGSPAPCSLSPSTHKRRLADWRSSVLRAEAGPPHPRELLLLSYLRSSWPTAERSRRDTYWRDSPLATLESPPAPDRIPDSKCRLALCCG